MPEPDKNRDQPDRIDGDKERNEGEEKFLDHGIMAARFRFTGQFFYTMIPYPINETFAYEILSTVDPIVRRRRYALRR